MKPRLVDQEIGNVKLVIYESALKKLNWIDRGILKLIDLDSIQDLERVVPSLLSSVVGNQGEYRQGLRARLVNLYRELNDDKKRVFSDLLQFFFYDLRNSIKSARFAAEIMKELELGKYSKP